MRLSNLECKMYHVNKNYKNVDQSIIMFVKMYQYFELEKQNYKRKTMIECNHPGGGPFILGSRFATTLT